MYVNKKPLLFSIMLLLGIVYMSENVVGDGTIAVGMMPLYIARGDTPFAVRFTVTGLMPHTDYTYTARIHRSGGTYGSFWSDNSRKETPGWRTAYSTLGNTGDFRVAFPSGMSLTTTIDGNLYAPTETVNAGRDKDIPAIFHSIEQAKELSDGSYVHVSGVVTAPKGVFSKSEAYIQDATARIRICKSNGMPNLSLGDRVDVSGILCEKKNEREIQISMAWRESSGNIPPPPHITLTADSMCEENEGLLLEISHATVTSTGKSAFILDDGSGSARISLYPSTGISTKRYAGFGVGAVVRIVGIAGQADDAHELKPRFLSDITALIPAPIPRPMHNLP
jgi:hypothetical protein